MCYLVLSLSDRDLIRILLQSRRFDFESLLLSEGDPSNEALEVEESVSVSQGCNSIDTLNLESGPGL